ncbi:MAG TPA: hypothetical protein VD846_11580 [Allosphingosinicella sp.]|nr:hypothetical protein [Allosphingosinicella sp.]
MAVQPTYPGVYVVEAPSGVRAIAGVSTSVAAFVGMTARGPVNVPTKIFSPRDFETKFAGAAQVGELPDQVRQFFVNGGGTAWIVRNAAGATDGASMTASSTLRNENRLGGDAVGVLTVSAKDAGAIGNLIRVEIDYDTDSERSFNMKVFRLEEQKDGSFKRTDEATYTNLTMDPLGTRYAPVIVTAQSPLVSVAAAAGLPGPTGDNLSQSGLIFSDLPAELDAHVAANRHWFMISVGHRPPVGVSLAGLAAGGTLGAATTFIENQINNALDDASVTVQTVALVPGEIVLQILSADGAVAISSASLNDIAKPLGLGSANGGLEYDGYSPFRPAPNGYVTRAHGSTPFSRIHAFALADKGMGNWEVTGARNADGPVSGFAAGTTMSADATRGPNVVGSFAAVAGSLAAIATAIKNHPNQDFKAAVHGLRLRILPTYGNDDSDLSMSLSNATAPQIFTQGGQIGQRANAPTNVLRYPIGNAVPPPPPPTGPGGDYRALLNAGNNGLPGLPADYDYSFDKLARADGIFNMLVLPRAEVAGGPAQSDADRSALWGPASAFCKRERAFLLVDPPSDAGAWSTAALAVTGVKQLRAGIVQDHAAVYWSRVRTTGGDGKPITIDPSGTMAGVYAAIDVRRGVWKAPAGLEAILIGVKGLEYPITNEENGITNPEALNTLRSMVAGPVAWGARTMMGYEGAPDQDYKYVPVRRLALMIEESLYQGMQPYVFEPNDEPLWGQIRLSVGGFMNGLFLDGAFAGKVPGEAYYVACGPTTTTPEEIALGIINVEVGFAPLRPAEFVIVTLKQLVNQSGAQ